MLLFDAWLIRSCSSSVAIWVLLHSILLVFSDVTDFNPYTFSAIFFCSLATATFLLLLLICLPVSHSYLLSLFVFEVPIVISVSAMSRFGWLPQRLSTSIYRCLLSLSTTAEDSFSEIFLAAPHISRCSLFRQLILKALLNARVIRIAISLWHLSLSACNLLSSASTCKFDFALAIYPLLYFHSWLLFYSRSYLITCNSPYLRLLTLLYCYSTLASSLSTHVIWFCWALLFLNHFSYSYICHSDFSHIGILGLYEIILCNPAVWCLLSHAVSYVAFRIWFHFDVWIFLILFLKQYFAVCFSIVFASVCFVLQNPYCAVAAQ